MSKLYNMIEDALMKKGLSIPSDSFIFTADYKPSDEILKALTLQDDIYTKDMYTDEDLKTEGIGQLDYIKNKDVERENDKKVEEIDAEKIIKDIFTPKEQEELWKTLITNNESYNIILSVAKEYLKEKFLTLPGLKREIKYIDLNTQNKEINKNEKDTLKTNLEDTEEVLSDIKAKLKQLEKEKEFSYKEPENIKELKQNVKTEVDKINYERIALTNEVEQLEKAINKLPTFSLNDEVELNIIKTDLENIKSTSNNFKDVSPKLDIKLNIEQQKENLIKSFRNFQIKFCNWISDLSKYKDFLYTISNYDNLKTLINIFVDNEQTLPGPDNTNMTKHKPSNDENILRELIKAKVLSKENVYPYNPDSIGIIKGNPRFNEAIIFSESDPYKLKIALANVGISIEDINTPFLFDPENNDPSQWVQIGGVYKDEVDTNNIEHVLLRPLESRRDPSSTNITDIYKYSNNLISVPLNKLKAELLTAKKAILNGSKSLPRSEGEWWPLSDDQVRFALARGMIEFANKERFDDIFALDLLKIFDATPAAKIISNALNLYSKEHKIQAYTSDGKVVYKIFVPDIHGVDNEHKQANTYEKQFKKSQRYK